MGWSLARPISGKRPAITSIAGLQAALDGKLGASATIDGGTYAGVTAVAGGITITAHPQDVTASSFGAVLSSAQVPAAPSGRTDEHWQRRVEFAGGKWFLTANPQGVEPVVLAYSDNGLAWTQTTVPFSGSGIYSRIASSGSAYVTAESWGGGVYRSASGSSWASATSFPSGAFVLGESDNLALSGGGSVWVQRRASTGGAGATFGRTLYRSTDGTSWTTISLPPCTSSGTFNSQALGSLTGVYESNGRLFATFQGRGSGLSSFPSALHTSSDGGSTWASVGSISNLAAAGQTGTGARYSAVVYSQSLWWCFAGGTHITSSNGTSWSASAAPDGFAPRSVAASTNVVLAYGSGANPLRRWIVGQDIGTPVTIPGMTLGSAGGIARIGGRFVAYSTGATIGVSSDGLSWQAVTLPYAPASLPSLPAASEDAIVFAVLNPTTSILERTVRLSLSTGGSASMIVAATATGGVPVAYQWQRSLPGSSAWSDVSLANTATLSISNAQPSDSGTRYRCIVSASGYVSATSNPATLTVT